METDDEWHWVQQQTVPMLGLLSCSDGEEYNTKQQEDNNVRSIIGFRSFGLNMVQCGDADLEKKIEEKIDQFIGWIEKHPNKKSQICLSFYEVKGKQAKWFGNNRVERLYWEQWYINLNVVHPKTQYSHSHHTKVVTDPGEIELQRSVRHATLESSLRDVLFQILMFVNEKKDHIPPVAEGPDVKGLTFSYDITIPSTSDFLFSMDMFKKMPTMLG